MIADPRPIRSNANQTHLLHLKDLQILNSFLLYTLIVAR